MRVRCRREQEVKPMRSQQAEHPKQSGRAGRPSKKATDLFAHVLAKREPSTTANARWPTNGWMAQLQRENKQTRGGEVVAQNHVTVGTARSRRDAAHMASLGGYTAVRNTSA